MYSLSLHTHRALALTAQGWIGAIARLQGALADALGYRFYSSSLLLLYEGDPAAAPQPRVRFIDFANTRVDSVGGPDEVCFTNRFIIIHLRWAHHAWVIMQTV